MMHALNVLKAKIKNKKSKLQNVTTKIIKDLKWLKICFPLITLTWSDAKVIFKNGNKLSKYFAWVICVLSV